MENLDGLPVLLFEDQPALDRWLVDHHADSKGAWLKIAKKAIGLRSVTYAEAVETAIIYGWIDSQKRAFDEQYFIQKFTPRSAKSVWSRTNRDKALDLIKTGRMQPSGLRQVEIAQANSEWDKAYEPQSRMQIPADLQAELNRNPAAKSFFATLNSANRYAVLYRLQSVRKPETRRARIRQFIEMLTRHERLHP